MKNKKVTEDSQEITVVRRVKHFGGKHTTTYYSDGSTCNTYEDGYKSNAESITKTFSDPMNTATTANTATTKKPTKATKSKKASTKKPIKKVDTAPAADTPTTPKVSRADVKTAVENFLQNPPDKPLTLAQVYETIGFEHRQVYMMVREHGVPAGKSDAPGKGRKETLFTFNKVA